MRALKKAIQTTWTSIFGPTAKNRRRRAIAMAAGDQLESRRLLATLVTANKLTYQDVDGDNVEVTFSKPIPSVAAANQIFQFDTGTVNGSNTTKQQLRSINLANLTQAAGTTIITKAVRSAANGGDGFAAIGQIDATGIDISTVTIDGDLGRILAGDATTTQGLGALTVHSMGRFGTFTGATNLNSVINGRLLSLKSRTDIKDASITVQGGVGGVNGQIGSITIGGSLIGGASANTGSITSTGDMGAVIVTGDLIGAGVGTGSISAGGKLASATIGGTVFGGTGADSGQIVSALDMGAVKVTGDLVGGTAFRSGQIDAGGKLTSVTIGGSLIGSSGTASGLVSSGFDMGAVKVTGDVRGGAGSSSGQIFSHSKLASVTIGGSLIGSSGDGSGQVLSELDMGPVVITGNVQGGSFLSTTAFESTGAIVSFGKLTSVTIGGSLIGGAGVFSGWVLSDLDMGAVKITGDVRGGTGFSSGLVESHAKLASASVGGSLIGGAGVDSGSVTSQSDMGAVKVAKDIVGGSNTRSGAILSSTKITSTAIGGSLIGGSGLASGHIGSGSDLTTLSIAGSIRGGSASGSANLVSSGSVFAGRIGTMTLGGSLIAGVDTTSGSFSNNGAIGVVNDIGSLTIKGSVVGNTSNRALITARGQLTPAGTTDLAIGKLTVTGRVEHALIHAGIRGDSTTFGRNADAQIGPVVVSGDWIASDLVAGALAGLDGKFGTADDTKMPGTNGVSGFKDVPTVFSKITSIVIGGQAYGTPGGTDHFGIVAQNIGSFKLKGGLTTFPLLAGNGNDNFMIGLFGDFRLRELL